MVQCKKYSFKVSTKKKKERKKEKYLVFEGA